MDVINRPSGQGVLQQLKSNNHLRSSREKKRVTSREQSTLALARTAAVRCLSTNISRLSMSRSPPSSFVCSLWGLCFVGSVAMHVALHLVSIRILEELFFVQARCRLGFDRRVDVAIYQTGLIGQNRLAIIGTNNPVSRVRLEMTIHERRLNDASARALINSDPILMPTAIPRCLGRLMWDGVMPTPA